MRRRSVLLVGFGLGGLVVMVLVGLAGGVLGLPGQRSAGANLTSPSRSPDPSPSALPSLDPSLLSPTPPADAAGPGARAGEALIYDPENHGLLLYGGATSNTTLGDTWLWDGRSWKRLDVLGPPARSAAMVAYDSVRHVVVLFGGSGPAGTGQGLYFQDTWTWDGTQWQVMHPAHLPNPRMRAGMVFDERRGVTVMFGGEGETATHGVATYIATWTWDGTDWTLADTAVNPPARHFFGMAYDAARGLTVLFGGSMGGARLNDTWTWDGTRWTQLSVPAPTARGWAQLAYDVATKTVVGYVFDTSANEPAEFTVVWDGGQWTDRTGATDPTARAEVRMTYDPETSQVVLYGPTAQTWIWNGTAWSVWQPA
jgi:hypothetical protein